MARIPWTAPKSTVIFGRLMFRKPQMSLEAKLPPPLRDGFNMLLEVVFAGWKEDMGKLESDSNLTVVGDIGRMNAHIIDFHQNALVPA